MKESTCVRHIFWRAGYGMKATRLVRGEAVTNRSLNCDIAITAYFTNSGGWFEKALHGPGRDIGIYKQADCSASPASQSDRLSPLVIDNP
jgi:hypothetical protein